MANVETRCYEYRFLRSGCDLRTDIYMSGGSTTSLYFIEIWARGGSREEGTARSSARRGPFDEAWSMGLEAESNGESPFFEKPILSFEGWVGNVAVRRPRSPITPSDHPRSRRSPSAVLCVDVCDDPSSFETFLSFG